MVTLVSSLAPPVYKPAFPPRPAANQELASKTKCKNDVITNIRAILG
jgi:hypothetical protein